MKASLQPKPMYCSRDYYYSSRYFCLFYRMARTKLMPKKDRKGGERWVLWSKEQRKELAERGWRPPPSAPPILSQEALTHKGGGEEDGRGREVGGGGKMARGCGQVTIVIANPTVGPDGCRGQAIWFRKGSASQEEAPTYCGRQSPPRRNSSGLVK